MLLGRKRVEIQWGKIELVLSAEQIDEGYLEEQVGRDNPWISRMKLNCVC
ncbi:hypothetical protein ACRRTK_010382 [Alexandromys fortis]